MNKISATAARQNFSDMIEKARDEPIMVTEHGREKAVMMHPELAKLALQVLEDAYDVEQATKALERIDAGLERTYSLGEVAAELGIELATKV